MATADSDKQLRELAQVRGFKLVKSRRRKPGGDFGHYGLRDAKTGKDCFGIGERGLKASAEEIASFLREQANADWKSSLAAPAAAPKPSRPKKPRAHDEAPPPEQTKARAEAPSSPEKRDKIPVSRNRGRSPAKTPEPKARPQPKPALLLRTATSSDAAGLAALMEQGKVPTTRKLASLIASLEAEGKPVIVADEGGIVGAVSYDVITSIQRGAALGRIVFLTTAKPDRRRGIGTKLLKAAEARLRKLGCSTFELVHDIELSNANSFLRRHGYQRSAYRFAHEPNEE